MRTWSIEETVIRAQSAVAVAMQGVWDVFTHRPAYSNSHPIPGCPSPSDCRGFGCAGDCCEASEAPGYDDDPMVSDSYLRYHDDTPNPTEPGLTDDELVGVRGLLQERYETSTAVQCSGSVEHPAGGSTHSPKESPRPAPQLDWHGWSIPAITECLAEHVPQLSDRGLINCCNPFSIEVVHKHCVDEQAWREHVAPLIASRLACDPARAIAALSGTAAEWSHRDWKLGFGSGIEHSIAALRAEISRLDSRWPHAEDVLAHLITLLKIDLQKSK